MTDQTNVEQSAQEPVSEMDAVLNEARTPAEAQPADGEQPQSEAPEAEAEKPAKPKKSANERIAELTWKAREAERRAEAAEARLRQTSAPEPQQRDPLNPANYPNGQFDPAYQAALIEQKAQQAARAILAEERALESQRQSAQRWEAQTREAMTKHEDFSEVVTLGAAEGAWACTEEMRDLITQSDVGAEVAYRLAKDPDLSFRIAAMPERQQAREIGKLEALIEAERSRPQPNKVTNAPTPPPQVRGANGRFGVPPDTNDFAAFEKQFGN